MNQPPVNICPLRGNYCIEDRCAWYNCAASECAVVSIADSLSDAAAELANRSGNAAAV